MARWRAQWASHVAQPQHRNAYYLMANTIVGAAVGMVFWLLLARLVGLGPAEIGLGLATVALGTTVGIVAKGGLDLALLRTVPGTGRRGGAALLRLAVLIGVAAALFLTFVFAATSYLGRWDTDVATIGWALVALIGALLVTTWLQDAYFLAEGEARYSFLRNLVFSAARLALPFAVVAFALPHPVALTWALALAASAVAAVLFTRRLPWREGGKAPRRAFMTSALRNISGSAAEFLPGLLLAPMVLVIDGEEAAAYFGIAWTAASILFLASAAVSRVALAEMVRNGSGSHAAAIRRSVTQQLWLLAPAALLGIALAPYALAIFGAEYARNGATVLMILCASLVVVAPAYLYLAVLRAQERPWPLVLFPAAMVAALALLAPALEARYGLPGVAAAWLLANLPFGAWAAWRLRLLSREVMPHGVAPTIHRAPHAE